MEIKNFLLPLLLISAFAWGEINRLYIVSQYDWGGKTGFYIDFENSSDASPCQFENIRLILGIADVDNWRFIVATPKWQLDRDYKARAIIDSQKGELYLDGELVGKSEGRFRPAKGDVTLYHIPHWAKGKADYLIILKSIRLSVDGKRKDFAFPERPLPLFLFEPQFPQSLPLETRERVDIEVVFRLIAYPNLKKLSPFIDRYGQCRFAQWEGKIKSDEDLKKAWEEEKGILASLAEPKGYDRFGGYELGGWKEKGTGFFRVVKRNGFWWLITPEGNPCFYIGLCGVPSFTWEMTPVTGRGFLFEWLPPKEGIYSSCWGRGVWGTNSAEEYVAFHTANMIRKYGEGWQEIALDLTRKRLKLWGFSGAGKWGEMAGMPFLPVLRRWDVPNIARHPDIFNPDIQEKFKESLRRQIEPRKNDPFVVGWSLGNEYEEIITREEIMEILGKGADVHAKRALIDYALREIYNGDRDVLVKTWGLEGKKGAIYEGKPIPPSEDIERVRLFYAEEYYKFIYKTVKEIDPNHLYFGFWIVPGWWESEDDWRISAKYCDVIGYDLYSLEFMSDWLKRLIEETGKPIICGEFSYPAFYDGERGFGVYHVWGRDDTHSGELYRRWVRDAARNPSCVGVAWFFYRDQPLTGRGPGSGEDLVYGEHYAFGMVDVGDRAKWDLVRRVKEANLSAIKWRLEAGH